MDQRRAGSSVGGTSNTSNMRSNGEAMTAPTPEQMRALAEKRAWSLWDMSEARGALRAAADQLEAVQKLLSEAHDKFAATYDAERMIGSGPSSIGVAGAPLALSVQRALGLLRAKATANIERLTADTAPQEARDE